MKYPDFLPVDKNSQKLIFGYAWSEMGGASLVTGL